MDTQDYGYVLTDLIMEDILRGDGGQEEEITPSRAAPTAPTPSCDTLTVTNGDNVYAREFLVRTLNKIAEGKDAVATNWVSHYDNPMPERGDKPYHGDWCASHRRGEFQEMKVRFQCYCIDVGAAVFRLKPVQEAGLRFCVDDLRAKKEADHLELADGRFFERYAGFPNVSVAVLHQSLFLHN